nr:disease resistance protein [Tanacetum cinerariifolium]
MREVDKNEILLALTLSYDYLLTHVKQCFAYCCLFPKGDVLEKDQLILVWVTNSLIDFYEDGEEVFKCLVQRFFISSYRMHDLVHDLAHYVMKHDCAIIEKGKDIIIPDEVIHLSSSCPAFMFSLNDLQRSRYLLSILIFNNGYTTRKMSFSDTANVKKSVSKCLFASPYVTEKSGGKSIY